MFNFIKQSIRILVTHKAVNYGLLVLIFIATLSYVYFANVTVRTLSVLEKTKQQMQSLSIKVSEMEAKRLAVENNVNLDKAKYLGFVEVNNPTFIMKSSNKVTLSLKTD